MPDRLPVTTHHVMPYWLDRYLDGISYDAFFDRFGIDAIRWILPLRAEKGTVEIDRHGFTSNDDWRVEATDVPGGEYRTIRYRIHHAARHADDGNAGQRVHCVGERAAHQAQAGH